MAARGESSNCLKMWSISDLTTPVKQFIGHTDVITAFDWRIRQLGNGKLGTDGPTVTVIYRHRLSIGHMVKRSNFENLAHRYCVDRHFIHKESSFTHFIRFKLAIRKLYS